MGNARNVMTKRMRCFICGKWMEVGQSFVFMELRAYSKTRLLPAHPEHAHPLGGLTQELDKLKAQAAKNGHGEEEHYGHTGLAYADPSDFYVI
jgi:hypothetical protein